MAALTAIELGADTCVLVKATVRGPDVRVAAVESLDPSSFPGPDLFAGALKQLRKSRGLARRARVVLWGVPEGARTTDPSVAPLLAPLKRAGFRLDRVVSPCNALAALARVRQPRHDAAVVWLAVNRSGVAISVIRPGEQLFAHSFQWDSSVGAIGSQARLLQRYSLVSYLAPEIRRGIEQARTRGWRVDAIVTCGNLPDLRSLTMPLIEEMDLEVETLDSLEGLVLKPALKDKLIEMAPAIRIACAGAVARAERLGGTAPGRRFRGGAVFRAAALVIAVGGLGWLWYSGRTTSSQPTPQAVRTTAAPPARGDEPHTTAPPGANTANAPAQAVPAANTKPPLTAPPPVTNKPAVAAPTPVIARPAPPPVPVNNRPPAATPLPKPASPAEKAAPPAPVTKTAPDTAVPAAPEKKAMAAQAQQEQSAAPRRQKQNSRTEKPDAQQAQALPLSDPIPHVTTILVSQERRFAMLDGGRVVTVGDSIGSRVVSAIEPRAIVLREPSGVQIRVGLGGRLMGVEKGR